MQPFSANVESEDSRLHSEVPPVPATDATGAGHPDVVVAPPLPDTAEHAGKLTSYNNFQTNNDQLTVVYGRKTYWPNSVNNQCQVTMMEFIDLCFFMAVTRIKKGDVACGPVLPGSTLYSLVPRHRIFCARPAAL